jgi:hypothetical protein
MEFIFHANTISYPHVETPFRFVTHKNDWNRNLRDVVHSQLKATSKYRKDESLAQWVGTLIGLDEDDTEQRPLCVMKRPKSADTSLHPSSQPSYYKLDWDIPLCKTLMSTHFVEFPTIEVMEESQFTGTLVDSKGVAGYHKPQVARKRRRVETKAGKQAIATLVGGYGSEESTDGESPRERDTNVIGGVDYESDEGTGEEDADCEEESALDEDNFREILDSVVHEPLVFPCAENEDEDLDWGDSDDEDATADIVKQAGTQSG